MVYAVIIAWALQFMFLVSVTEQWGDDPAKFFNESFLQAGQPGTLSFVPVLGIFFTIVWLIVLVVGKGVRVCSEQINSSYLLLLYYLWLWL